ncbi:E3 ubiquitin-protein ligase RNF186 [Bufo gargarizans]|uniref:E3 ubiquitin-protein ligase RNF186 n=1 Tax=Bufo gargarizans TaxID=30331 RepID=UPI001CF3E5C2|nr:E3 ubiquitin-protein ligase RNF186 [Bufo gargarizans]
MEAPLDHGPTGTEEAEPEIIQTLHGWSTSGAPPGPDVAETAPVEDQQPSLHDIDPSSCSSPTNGPDSGLTDMDCPICFSRYDNCRVPKELSCKHNFCAVCLKLLICNEVGTWRIVCPICRALTTVFGGLVCTLQNQESLMSRLENPKPKAEVLQPLEVVLRLDGHSQCDPRDDERHGNLTIETRRLVILLLNLLIVLIIIMQFLYTGIIKWVLGFTLGIVVIITVLLCFNPNCRISFPKVANQQNGQ